MSTQKETRMSAVIHRRRSSPHDPSNLRGGSNASSWNDSVVERYSIFRFKLKTGSRFCDSMITPFRALYSIEIKQFI